jgi:hypothetical protein
MTRTGVTAVDVSDLMNVNITRAKTAGGTTSTIIGLINRFVLGILHALLVGEFINE